MQAIVTRYLGPTGFKGARIKATAAAGSVTIPYPHEYDIEGAHNEAALALLEKMGWGGTWTGGGLPNEAGNVYVCSVGRFKGKARVVGHKKRNETPAQAS